MQLDETRALGLRSLAFGELPPGLGEFVEGALNPELREFHFHADIVVVTFSTLFALAGIGVAAALYYTRKPNPTIAPVHRLVSHLYYWNELAEDVIVRGVLYRGIGRAAAAFDKYVVDGAVNGVATVTRIAGDVFRRSETGQLQAYTSAYIVGVVFAAGALFVLAGGLLDRVMP